MKHEHVVWSVTVWGLPLLCPLHLHLLHLNIGKGHELEITTEPVSQRKHAKEMQNGTHITNE